jgi:hypothetical protein
LGIVGIFNQELKQSFIDNYKLYKRNYLQIKNKTYFDLSCSIDMVVEQLNLSLLSQNNYTVDVLNRKNDFIHLYGRKKFYKKSIDWVKSESEKFDTWKEFKNKLDNYDKNNLVFRHFTHFE